MFAPRDAELIIAGNFTFKLVTDTKCIAIGTFMVCRYYKYVRQEMLKNFKAGTSCRGVPMSLPRLVELVRACASSVCIA